jgi:outer membrane protein assembly complex protein YaeT
MGHSRSRSVGWLSLIIALLSLHLPHHSQAATSPDGATQVLLIHFEGVKHLSVKEIKKRFNTKEKRFHWFTKAALDDKVLAEDLKRLEQYYKSQGFYHMRVVSHKISPVIGNKMRLDIVVEEGPPLMVHAVHLKVNDQLEGPWHNQLNTLMPLKPGHRFTSEGYRDCEKMVLRFFGDWGYPKAKVDLHARLDKGSNQGDVTLQVTTGPICFFGPVTLEGNQRVADHVILRELAFHHGERFSTEKIQESQRRLFNLSLFQLVDMNVEEMEGEATELPIRILLKESKKQTVRAGVGYGTEDQFRGRLEWEIRDFLGDGRRLEFDAKASSITQLFEANFVQPYVFGRQWTLTSKAGIIHEDQQAFENRKIYTTTMIDYKIDSQLSSRFGYSFEANRLLDVNLDLLSREPIDSENQEFLVSSLLGGLSWVKVDDPLHPKSGFQILPNLEWASVAFGSEVDFFKMSLEGRGYVPVMDYGVLAGKLLWGTIVSLEDTNGIPVFKRFFAGGSNSVRGYPYQRLGPLDDDGDPIGGLTLLEGSVEARFPLPFYKSLEGVVFFDFGNVYEEHFSLFQEGLRYTSGCGIRYMTPVGPIRLDVGYELNPPKQDFFQPYQFHFSIGQAF